MESTNRNVLIIIVVILLAACCCASAAGAVAVGMSVSRALETFGGFEAFEVFEGLEELGLRESDRIEQTFSVGRAPSLRVQNFAGTVTVWAGESGEIHVVATRRATRASDLDRIRVEMEEVDGGLSIETRRLSSLDNVSVDLEIWVPADTRLRVANGAGNITIREVTGGIEADSGAGNIDVLDAAGAVRLRLGAGAISYEGTPSGECRFESGAGNITLRLPTSLEVRVDAGAGMGMVDVDFEVDGRITMRNVVGVIGSGEQGSIYAHTGVGNVNLLRR